MTDCRWAEEGRCRASVWKRDTYRRTGGRRRFTMHYTEEQCSRKPGASGYCWQHKPDARLNRPHGRRRSVCNLPGCSCGKPDVVTAAPRRKRGGR